MNLCLLHLLTAVLFIVACTVESDPRAIPTDFSKRNLRYSAAWSKKSLSAKFRDGGSICVTMTDGCLCNIRETTSGGLSILYENKLCYVGAAADANYFRLGLNCYTPSSEDSAKLCSIAKAKANCTDADGANEQSLLFRMGFVDEPNPNASQLIIPAEFVPPANPDPSTLPIPVAETLDVVSDLKFCTPE